MNLFILGVTGSIGIQTLDIVRASNGDFNVVSVAANRNVKKMKEVIEELLILQRIYPMICEATPEMPAISLYDLGIPMNIIGSETRDEILLLRERYS